MLPDSLAAGNDPLVFSVLTLTPDNFWSKKTRVGGNLIEGELIQSQ